MSDNYDGPALAQKIMRQQAEIERLRAQLAEARLNWKLCEDQLLALREGLADAIAILSTFHGEDDVDAFLAKHKEQA